MAKYEELELRKFDIKSLVSDSTVLLLGRRRSGKSVVLNTPVIMYDGRIKMVQNIVAGDQVMGDDSTPRNVLETHSGNDIMYKVINRYGDSYTVNSHHILSLKFKDSKTLRYKGDYYQVTWFNIDKLKLDYMLFNSFKEAKRFFNKLPEQQIVDINIQDYLKLPRSLQCHLHGYQVPIEFTNNYFLNIEAYTFGYQVTKRIPFKYKCNTRENRLQLLAGIIDNHKGSYYKNKFELNVHDQLLNDLIYLIKSLGFICFKHVKRNCLVIIGNLQEIPTKKTSLKNTNKNVLSSPIQIILLPKDDYYGIELDGNNRYILGNFIVTHNSWLVRDIFYNHRDIPSGIVFSGTEEANPFFRDFIPDCFIHNEYDPDLINKIMNKQKQKIRDAKDRGVKDGKSAANNFFIVLDDMLHDAGAWKNDKTIKNIFYNGRHYNFLFILTMQYVNGIPPGLRSNIDYVFIFNEPSITNRKKIWQDYAAIIPTFDHFCNILDACTQNHECLVIKTSTNSIDLRDSIFYYKAKEHSKFQAGHYKFWKFHKKNYNDNYENDNLNTDIRLSNLKDKFANTKKLKVIVSRKDDRIVDIVSSS